MSSSWTERQGQVNDLQDRSKGELIEILRRQEKLLSNKRFVQSLPDKGGKITDFVQRLQLALAHLEGEEKNQGTLPCVMTTEFQNKYQQASVLRQSRHHKDPDPPQTSQKTRQSGIAAPELSKDKKALLTAGSVQDSVCFSAPEDSSGLQASLNVGMETAGVAQVSLHSDRAKETDLAEAFERVTLSDDATVTGGLKKAGTSDDATGNLFWQLHKKPHYLEILEKSEFNESTMRPKYKPNQFAQKTGGSPTGSSSPSRDTGGLIHLSVEARKQRDRKHLDDITAAKLPPLHYSPAQLLSLGESASLQRAQTRKCEELQANLAAQKLSERLGVSTGSYSPEGESRSGYREVHFEEALQSSEDD